MRFRGQLMRFRKTALDITKGAKLHYTDTSYEHRLYEHQQRTPATDTTNGQKFATSQHLDMSRCWVELL